MSASATLTYNQDHLTNTFASNLQFFEQNLPHIYKAFANYQAGPNKLGIDDSEQLNIICGNGWLYSKSIQALVQKQLVDFQDNCPSLQMTNSTITKTLEEPHAKGGINKHYHRLLNEIHPENEKNTNFPCILSLGVGLGVHLQGLAELEPLQLIIYEPHIDFFYASLFVCNYAQLAMPFMNNKHRRIDFVIGQTPAQLLSFFVQQTQTPHIMNLVKVGLFQHYTNETLVEANQLLVQRYPQIMTKGGFLEDTLIGLNHMMIKTGNPMPFLSNKAKIDSSLPVILVASGPSIDQYINLISKIQDQAVIISCSSSIQVCHKAGITPDFHVEVERGISTLNSLNTVQDQERLKQTTLLSFNVIHPDVEKRFKNVIYAFKPSELATDLYLSTLPDIYKNTLSLKNSNPTSGNGSLAFAIAIGFQKIILAGFDCAYLNETQHHSKNTLYYTHGVQQANNDADIYATSVHGKKLKTNLLLEGSRQNLMALLKDNDHVQCFNASQGASIDGTQFIDTNVFNELMAKIANQKDKVAALSHFQKSAIQSISIPRNKKSNIEKELNFLIDSCSNTLEKTLQILQSCTNDWQSVFHGLTQVQSLLHILQKQAPNSRHILDGTIYNVSLCISTAMLQPSHVHDYLIQAIDITNKFITAGLKLLRSDTNLREEDINFKAAILESSNTGINTKQKFKVSLFEKNISFFERNIPSLYTSIINHSPKYFHLNKDEKGFDNISLGNAWFYPINHAQFSSNQVQTNNITPLCLSTTRKRTEIDDSNKHLIQSHYLKKFVNKYYDESAVKKSKLNNSSYIPSVVFLGVGLGAHLQQALLSRLYKNIYIYEPELDFFYASLHTTDYEKLIKNLHTDQNIFFVINQSAHVLCQTILKSNLVSGFFNHTRLQIIEHYTSDNFEETKQALRNLYPSLFNQHGFFEDECIGISHTSKHLKANAKFITTTQNKKRNETALIIGSGPSLDEQIDKIKLIKDKVVIFSCSSSLEILHKNGIKPDFHVEIERLDGMIPRLEFINDEEYLKDITLLCLNTIHPKLLEYFGDHINALKMNDAGQLILKNLLHEDALVLTYCNPTSGNGALAFAHALGFTDIVLTGIDMGQPSDDYHHSKDSLYYSDTKLNISKIETKYSCKGNFGIEVKTTDLLMQARNLLESLLKQKAEINCFNCSNGAYIEGATPLPIDKFIQNMSTKSSLNKTNLLSAIKNEKTYQIANSATEANKIHESFKECWLTSLKELENKIYNNNLLPEKINTITAFFKHLNSLHSVSNHLSNENSIDDFLFRSLTSKLTLNVMTLLLATEQHDNFKDYYQEIRHYWMEYNQTMLKYARETYGLSNDQLNIEPYLPKEKQP